MQGTESCFGLLSHRTSVREHHHLGQIGYCGIAGHRYRAGGGLLQAGYDFEHGALSGPVFPHQGYPVLVAHDETHVAE